MIIGVLKEQAPETRVSLVPEVVIALTKLNVTVWIEDGAGMTAFFSNDAYTAAGAVIKSAADINLIPLKEDSTMKLSSNYSIAPFTVPHRDEFTETVGFGIQTGNHKTIFIPDIDKWNKFEMDIATIITQSNLALLDGTFYRDGEIPGRAMSEIPHPFIEESIFQFDSLTAVDKKKIRFIHFNHTNPLLNEISDELRKIASMGFMIAKQGELIPLNVNK